MKQMRVIELTDDVLLSFFVEYINYYILVRILNQYQIILK